MSHSEEGLRCAALRSRNRRKGTSCGLWRDTDGRVLCNGQNLMETSWRKPPKAKPAWDSSGFWIRTPIVPSGWHEMPNSDLEIYTLQAKQRGQSLEARLKSWAKGNWARLHVDRAFRVRIWGFWRRWGHVVDAPCPLWFRRLEGGSFEEVARRAVAMPKSGKRNLSQRARRSA